MEEGLETIVEGYGPLFINMYIHNMFIKQGLLEIASERFLGHLPVLIYC